MFFDALKSLGFVRLQRSAYTRHVESRERARVIESEVQEFADSALGDVFCLRIPDVQYRRGNLMRKGQDQNSFEFDLSPASLQLAFF